MVDAADVDAVMPELLPVERRSLGGDAPAAGGFAPGLIGRAAAALPSSEPPVLGSASASLPVGAWNAVMPLGVPTPLGPS